MSEKPEVENEEVVELGVRYVRTAAGAARFGQPVGSIIMTDKAAPTQVTAKTAETKKRRVVKPASESTEDSKPTAKKTPADNDDEGTTEIPEGSKIFSLKSDPKAKVAITPDGKAHLLTENGPAELGTVVDDVKLKEWQDSGELIIDHSSQASITSTEPHTVRPTSP